MKKFLLFSIVTLFVGMSMNGCTKTWNGVKHDTSEAWDTSKKAVHEATA